MGALRGGGIQGASNRRGVPGPAAADMRDAPRRARHRLRGYRSQRHARLQHALQSFGEAEAAAERPLHGIERGGHDMGARFGSAREAGSADSQPRGPVSIDRLLPGLFRRRARRRAHRQVDRLLGPLSHFGHGVRDGRADLGGRACVVALHPGRHGGLDDAGRVFRDTPPQRDGRAAGGCFRLHLPRLRATRRRGSHDSGAAGRRSERCVCRGPRVRATPGR